MNNYKDRVPAATGAIEFLFDPQHGIAIKASSFRALYFVAVSMDGHRLLATVPAAGLGQEMVYPKPSVLTYIQSDEQGMWGRNCPACQRYFRTTHVMDVGDVTYCPYCAASAPCLAFVSKEQRGYIRAFYEAYVRAYVRKANTQLDMKAITDETPAWHYSEEKLQFHFTCRPQACGAQTDILGRYGFCPRCGRSNARTLFCDDLVELIAHLERTRDTVTDAGQRGAVWEDVITKSVSKLEAMARHLRNILLRLPMTSRRRKELETLNFQQPIQADRCLREWFDIGLLEWRGNTVEPGRAVAKGDLPFVTKMVQRRHILIHNGGIVDQEYVEKSGDADARLGERIRIRSKEAKRFAELVLDMGQNFLDNIELALERS